MLAPNLLFNIKSDSFDIIDFKMTAGWAIISIVSRQIEHYCPLCGVKARKLHSYYYRSIKDLPAFDNRVLLKLKARKFYCSNDECDRKIFTEVFQDHFARYKRSSNRLYSKLLKIALLVGGNLGARLTKTLNISISSSSLIRLIHQQKLPSPIISDAIGIDDWAYKKGHNYGSAIIDLKKRKIIDLLPDREVLTVEEWFAQRPNVNIITRDRFSRYAKGISKGAHHAIQVADRWHLIKNLGEAITKLLERIRQSLRSKPVAPMSDLNTITQNEPALELPITVSKSKRYANFDLVKKYFAKNIPILRIAKMMGISKNTVKKYIHLQEPPPKIPGTSNIAQYSEYVQLRLKEAPDIEIIQLWKEVKERGYKGGKSTFYDYLRKYRRGPKHSLTKYSPLPSWSARQVSMLIYKRGELLSSRDKDLINDLTDKSPEIKIASNFVGRFREILEGQRGDLLKIWIDEVMVSQVRELGNFAKGLLTDITAVENAINLPWSNGQVEGQINKLKTVKRQMYGRASFSFLRKRLVLEAD